jgi:hypothetical protein
MGYFFHITTSINGDLIAMLGYACHIVILGCIHHITSKDYIRHNATFGNDSHIMMSIYLCHIMTMSLCSSHRDDKAMFVTLGGWGYVRHIVMTGLCSLHCDITVFFIM